MIIATKLSILDIFFWWGAGVVVTRIAHIAIRRPYIAHKYTKFEISYSPSSPDVGVSSKYILSVKSLMQRTCYISKIGNET